MENENVRGVVIMNEDYEIRYFVNSKEVNLCLICIFVSKVIL